MKPNRWVVSFLAFCLFSLFQAASLQAQPATNSPAKHCLWKVELKTNAIYLLGSLHLLNKDSYPLDPALEQAYQKSSAVVFEADLDELKSLKVQIQILTMGMCPEGETLANQVSKETYADWLACLKEAELPAAVFDLMKPWMAAVALAAMEMQKMGFDPLRGVDHHFFDAAKQDNKRTIALETPEFQLKLFGDLSKEENEEMLKNALKEIRSMKKELGEMVLAWKTGDAEKLDALAVKTMREFPQLYKKVLVERNRAWVEKLDKTADEGQDLLVVVGALHLVGKDGLVEMFRKKGFRVEQK